MSKQEELGMNNNEQESIEEYEFEPIRGYPMLRWKGKKSFKGTHYYPAQEREVYGEEIKGWLNKLYWGDNLQVMSHLLKRYRGEIDLIYLDPPFDSKADYKKKIKLRGKKIKNDHMAFEEKQYADIWTNDEYLQFMYERLILLRELLAEDGSIFIHCDNRVKSYMRLMLDEIFGKEKFRNEIIWHYFMGGKSKRFFAQKHDTILFYSKSDSWFFNEDVLETERILPYVPSLKSDKGVGEIPCASCGKGSGIWRSNVKMDDVWDMSGVFNMSNEWIDYPTQKPEALLERIIKASSNPGDIVFDPFMGCGTTQAVAMKLGRKFIGADINMGAIQTTIKRLVNVSEEIKKDPPELEFETEEGKHTINTFYTGLSVYNVNNYDLFRNPVQAKELLLEALEVNPLPNNSLYDGEKDGRLVKIMPVNRIATRQDLNSLITGFDYKIFEKRSKAHPGDPVESILLVCMGHEPDLAAHLQQSVTDKYELDVEIVDILRDRDDLVFKQDSDAEIEVEAGYLVIRNFYPMNLLDKLSMRKESVEEWRELVDSIVIDFDYNGEVMQPQVVDAPEKNEMVEGRYKIPKEHGKIKVKITDLLSEILEVEVE